MVDDKTDILGTVRAEGINFDEKIKECSDRGEVSKAIEWAQLQKLVTGLGGGVDSNTQTRILYELKCVAIHNRDLVKIVISYVPESKQRECMKEIYALCERIQAPVPINLIEDVDLDKILKKWGYTKVGA